MSVLLDSSVWVDHFRRRNDRLVDLIVMDLGLTHPMIVGELACGTPPAPRLQTLSDIELLRPVTPASVRETIEFIERETSVPVKIISVGPDRGETIVR